jgi:CheY-like chemotaxis protein
MKLYDRRIFILEDNLQNKALTQTMLELQGARVMIDRWGTDTIAQLQRFAPVDLILLDLMLPNNITGYDVFTKIRQLPAFDHVPVVAFSAADVSIAIPNTQAMGFTGFLSKPLDFVLFPFQILSLIQGESIWE